MANKKQALKYIRKTEARTERNRAQRSRLKTLLRKFRTLEEGADAQVRTERARELVSAFDKAVKSGVVHRNKASRIKAEASRVFGA